MFFIAFLHHGQGTTDENQPSGLILCFMKLHRPLLNKLNIFTNEAEIV